MKNFKHIEHRKKCCCCGEVAQLKRGRYFYCPTCYHIVHQTIAPVQNEPTESTTGDLMAALEHDVIRGRSAAEILDRILKERTV